MNAPVLPELERRILDMAAANTTPAAARRKPKHARQGLGLVLVGFAVLLLAGSAIGGIDGWDPLIGSAHKGFASSSRSAPPASEVWALGILRRAPVATDRSREVTNTLSVAGPQLHGIRPTSVRYLADVPGGGAAVLVPVQRLADDGDAGPHASQGGNPLCVLYPLAAHGARTTPTTGAALSCWDGADLRSGRARGTVHAADGWHLYGLVPDGVAQVQAHLPNGRWTTVRVRNNFYDVRAPVPQVGGAQVRWQNAAGRQIARPAR